MVVASTDTVIDDDFAERLLTAVDARNEIICRFPSPYDSTLSCGHDVVMGEIIATTADHRYICHECAP